MTALLEFENGKKVAESIFRDSMELFQEITKRKGNFLLVSSDGRRMTKGKIPSSVQGTFSWIK